MDRLKRFYRVSGWRGALFLAALVFFVGYEVYIGLWLYTVPVLFAALLVTYLSRDYLVDHAELVRKVSNYAIWVVLIAALLFRSKATPQSLPMNIFLMAFVGLFVGSFFWILSDDRWLRQMAAQVRTAEDEAETDEEEED